MPGFYPIVQIIKRLGLDISVSEIPSEQTMRMVALAQTPAKNNGVRVIVPPMSQRAGDICVLLPFYIQLHLTRLRERVPDFPDPKIDNLYLLSVWPHRLRTPKPLSPRVFQDLLRSESSGLLTVPAVLRGIPDHIAEVDSIVFGLGERSKRYLGFIGGNMAWKQVEGRMASHAYNRRIQTILEASTGGGWQPNRVEYAWLMRQYQWDLATMGLVARNAHLLDLRGVRFDAGESDRVGQCLMSRLKGKTESEIGEELGFEDSASYGHWTKKHHIDVIAEKPGHWYQDWLDACGLFGLEPNPAMMEAGYEPADAQGAILTVPHKEKQAANAPSIDEREQQDSECPAMASDGGNAQGISVPSDCKWEDIGLEYVTSETIAFRVPPSSRHERTFFECGMTNRHDKKAKRPWGRLTDAIADDGKMVDREDIAGDSNRSEKHQIKEMLCRITGLREDPFDRHKGGWRLKTKIVKSKQQENFEANVGGGKRADDGVSAVARHRAGNAKVKAPKAHWDKGDTKE